MHRYDLFIHTEKRNFDPMAYADHETAVELPTADATLAEVLAAAFAQGVRKGSARAGVYEVQGPRGIWSTPGNQNLAKSKKVVFKTWEELEAEDCEAQTAYIAGC